VARPDRRGRPRAADSRRAPKARHRSRDGARRWPRGQSEAPPDNPRERRDPDRRRRSARALGAIDVKKPPAAILTLGHKLAREIADPSPPCFSRRVSADQTWPGDARCRQGCPGTEWVTEGAQRCGDLRVPAESRIQDLCRRFGLPHGAARPSRTAMVRKGSPVRVRQRALPWIPPYRAESGGCGGVLRRGRVSSRVHHGGADVARVGCEGSRFSSRARRRTPPRCSYHA
jgi:hypothetical protein